MTNGGPSDQTLQQLQGKTLAQLQALRATLASTNWRIQMLSASAEERQQDSDLRILCDARIAQLENVQFSQIRDQMVANETELNQATDEMADALNDIDDVGKVLTTATTFLKVVAKVMAFVV
jgi:hypothetical protein